jgi:hypothetical protein
MNERKHPDQVDDGSVAPGEAPMPDELRWALRGLRRDIPPGRDLWPGIVERLERREQPEGPEEPSATARRIATSRRRNRFVPSIALAASLALAVGLGWQQRPAPGAGAGSPAAQLISAEAEAMTLEYQAALREVEGATPARTPANPTLQELDRSAAQIRTALTRDPDARFLLDRLQHTYERRLQLTQRLALS